ncbi:hypothetical protein L3Q82_023039, partial [Scortum barcoo]
MRALGWYCLSALLKTNIFIHVLFSLVNCLLHYDVGNRELLAIKVALEWRHWLEGAEHPCIVWTDHKNLRIPQNCKETKLQKSKVGFFFFYRFRFTLSYRPVSQNTKPDARSRLCDRKPRNRNPSYHPTVCATVSFSSGYHPESNDQTEWLNQELETCLRCLVVQNQTTWSDHLTWIEYAHNSLPTAATGLSPFQVVHGYQPPLFPVNEEEVTVPSAHVMAKRYRKIWAAARRMLLRGQERMKAAADCHRRPAPVYAPGQKVHMHSRKLVP